MRPTLGATVWVFDQDRRVYAKAEPGRIYSSSGPIYREHFVPYQIVGMTARSWILDNGLKIDKQTKQSAKDSRGYRKQIYDEAQVNDLCYIDEHRAALSRWVSTCADANMLRRIAALLQAPGEPGSGLRVDPVDGRGTEDSKRD